MDSDTARDFTAHNIRLDDGTETRPSAGATMDKHPVIQSVRRLLHVLYPGGVQGRTIIDIGCLEGGYTTEFARMGMIATGVEVRESNYNNCVFVRDRVNLPNLHFVRGDATDIAQFGEFDIFFVSGFLYHLDKPRKFLEELARNCRKALILWTHITHAEPNEAAQYYTLSDLSENEGLHGRWYTEHGDIPASELEQLKWASWNNNRSFWIQKEYLLQILVEIGFDLVFEEFDYMDDIIEDESYHKHDRVVIIAVKSGMSVERHAAPIKRRAPVEQCARVAKERIRIAEEGARMAEERARAAEERERAAEQGARVAQERARAAEDGLSRAQVMLDAVYSSTCWRITVPLRRVGMLLQRG